jgi:hypothetical protein
VRMLTPPLDGLKARLMVSRSGAALAGSARRNRVAAADVASYPNPCAYAWHPAIATVDSHLWGIDIHVMTTFKLRPRRYWSSSH